MSDVRTGKQNPARPIPDPFRAFKIKTVFVISPKFRFGRRLVITLHGVRSSPRSLIGDHRRWSSEAVNVAKISPLSLPSHTQLLQMLLTKAADHLKSALHRHRVPSAQPSIYHVNHRGVMWDLPRRLTSIRHETIILYAIGPTLGVAVRGDGAACMTPRRWCGKTRRINSSVRYSSDDENNARIQPAPYRVAPRVYKGINVLRMHGQPTYERDRDLLRRVSAPPK